MADKPYGPRTLTAIKEQCEKRGVPAEEMDSVLAHIEDVEGERVKEMDEAGLRRVNRNLPNLMEGYLEGKKRRGGPADPWAEPEAGDGDSGQTTVGGGGGPSPVDEEEL